VLRKDIHPGYHPLEPFSHRESSIIVPFGPPYILLSAYAAVQT
jgi:hypothetical protein